MRGWSVPSSTRRSSHRLLLPTMLAEEEGAELVEATIIITLLLTLMIGILSFARAYNVYETITRAAREGAKALVLTSCATCGNTFYAAASVRTNFVEPAIAAANLDSTKIQNYQSTYVWLDPTATPAQQCGVAISFTYPYQFALPFTSLNLTTISIPTTVQMRMENQPATCQAGTAVP